MKHIQAGALFVGLTGSCAGMFLIGYFVVHSLGVAGFAAAAVIAMVAVGCAAALVDWRTEE